MARPYDSTFRRTFLLFLFLVVVPSAGVSGFGILAIKNERAALEKSLEETYGRELKQVEQDLAAVLDDAVQSSPASVEGHDPAKVGEVLRGRSPVVGAVALIYGDGSVHAEESPALRAAEETLKAEARGLKPSDSSYVRVDTGAGHGLYAVKKLPDGTALAYRVDDQALTNTVPALARKRFPSERARIELSADPDVGPAPVGAMSRLIQEVEKARAQAETPSIASRRLAPPLSKFELRAMLPAGNEVASLSLRNRILYIALLVIFYVTLTLGVVFTARGIWREARLSRLKTDFVSAISHELRTPLTSIRMFVETLAMGRAQSEQETQECLNLIAKETERLTSMIENVLDWARIESGRKIYRKVPTDPHEVVEGALQAFRTQLMASGSMGTVDLKVELPKALPRVDVDGEAMSGVLLNLLHNAYKYTGAQKQIEVRAHERHKHVEIEVKDNGPGIAKRDHKRIFERFYRADDLLTRKTEGTGLGLSIAKRIVEAHGGKLSVRSELRQGSVFTVSLPEFRE